MSSAKEREINQEIYVFLDTYQSILNQLEFSYNGLSRAREQFPMSFLSKTGIESHVSKITDKNKSRIESANKEIAKCKESLKKVTAKINNNAGEDLDELKKLKNEQKKLETKILKSRSETQLIRKLELLITPERVTYFYEDLLLFVASCKHEALELWKYASSVFGDIQLNEEHFSGRMLIDVAEDALKDKGYTKIIQDFRIAYLSSRKELKELKQIMSRAKILRDTTAKLLSAFESDEVNFRKFAERKTLIGGL